MEVLREIRRSLLPGIEDAERRSRSGRKKSVESAFSFKKAGLMPCFDVIKSYKKRRWGTVRYQLRSWEIDVGGSVIRNLSRSGKLHKEYTIYDLRRVDKIASDSSSIYLDFQSANHPYTLFFVQKGGREGDAQAELFYQLVNAMLHESKIGTRRLSTVRKLCEKRHSLVPVSRISNIRSSSSSSSMDSTSPQLKKHMIMDRFEEGVTLTVATFNMGSAALPSDLSSWLAADGKFTDVYAIGLQECMYEPSDGYESHDQETIAKILNCVGLDYEIVANKSMVMTGLARIIVLAHKERAYCTRLITSGCKATGVANVYGNKGGLGVFLRIHNTSLCFLSCHLASGVRQKAQRHANMGTILEHLRVGELSDVEGYMQADYTFLFGDLNYRCNCTYEVGVALSGRGQEGWKELQTYDELQKDVESKEILEGFQEGEISFEPTYRYQRGSRDFSNKNGQAPSYTDRIFYRALPGRTIALKHYTAAPEVTTSDHTPVCASFGVPLSVPSPSQHTARCIFRRDVFEICVLEVIVKDLNNIEVPIYLDVATTTLNTVDRVVSQGSGILQRTKGGGKKAAEKTSEEGSVWDGHTQKMDKKIKKLALRFNMQGGIAGDPSILSETVDCSPSIADAGKQTTYVGIWNPGSLPRLKPHVVSYESLLQKHLFITLMVPVAGIQTIPIAHAAVSMSQLSSEKVAQRMDFSQALFRRGTSRGTISGTLHIIKRSL